MSNEVTKRLDSSSGYFIRWDAQVASNAIASGSWPNKTVADMARELAEKEPERVLLVDADQQLTAGALFEKASRLANWLLLKGIRPGQRISFMLPNWHEANIINLAAALIGAVVHPIVPIFREVECEYMLRDCASRIVFCPVNYRNFDFPEMLDRVRQSLSGQFEIITVRDAREGSPLLQTIISETAPLDQFLQVDPDSVKLIIYTSGTTGQPKGVLHSHNTIHAENLKTKSAAKLAKDDVMFNPSPVTHVTGALYGLNLPWFASMKVVLLDTWNQVKAYDLIEENTCTYMAGATPFLQSLIAESRLRQKPLTSLRRFTCGGAGVPPSLIYEAREALPNCLVWRAFGATECPTITVAPDSEGDIEHAAKTDGRIWKASVRIEDVTTGEVVEEGEDGEVLAKAENMALGYANEADNAAAYTADGYFRTGDLGRIVDQNFVVISGRKKDLIIRAGENISAKEIEDVLITLESVVEVAVVAAASERTGECVGAVIVPAAANEPVTLSELADTIMAFGLAKQKCPERLIIVESLPKTAAGKVRKDELRAWFKQELDLNS